MARPNVKTVILTDTEFETGRIINNKKEYGKRVNCGVLPNSTTKNINHGLKNVNFTGYEGMTNAGYKLPFTSTAANYNIQVLVNSTDVIIKTAVADYSTQTATVTVYYTKN